MRFSLIIIRCNFKNLTPILYLGDGGRGADGTKGADGHDGGPGIYLFIYLHFIIYLFIYYFMID